MTLTKRQKELLFICLTDKIHSYNKRIKAKKEAIIYSRYEDYNDKWNKEINEITENINAVNELIEILTK